MFGYERLPVGINTLNKILPENLCGVAGLERKTSHSLRVTCATRLFQNSVGEALIRERTGHRSDALLRYERKSEEQEKIVSTVLGPPAILKGNVISDLTEDLSTDISLPDFHFDVLDEVLRNYPMPTSDLSEGLGTDDCLPDFYFDVPDEVLSNYPMHVTETVSNINTTLSNCVFNHCVLCV